MIFALGMMAGVGLVGVLTGARGLWWRWRSLRPAMVEADRRISELFSRLRSGQKLAEVLEEADGPSLFFVVDGEVVWHRPIGPDDTAGE